VQFRGFFYERNFEFGDHVTKYVDFIFILVTGEIHYWSHLHSELTRTAGFEEEFVLVFSAN
jgi:hypothetical protein